MSRVLAAVLAVAAVAGLGAAGAAFGLRFEFENAVVSATFEATPRKLPRRGAPVKLTTVNRVWSRDGSVPAALSRLRFQFDKYGWIDAKGVPVCTLEKLAETTPSQARKRCAGALVGTGTAKARVQLPGAAPTTIGSPLSFFNGPKRKGLPTLIAHAYEKVPTRQALLVPIVIERIKKGRYGYRVEVELPEIAGGYGAATFAKAVLGRTFKRHGREVGYVNARCVGGRLQVYGTATFANGDFFPSTLASTCNVRD